MCTSEMDMHTAEILALLITEHNSLPLHKKSNSELL